jgi:heterodisulfide reductase subunit A
VTPVSESGARSGAAGAAAQGHGIRALLCECAGTMASNLDFDALERGIAGRGVTVERRRAWCGREGRSRLIEILEEGERAGRLVLVGCAPDFAARRLRTLTDRGLRLEAADIREGCSWVHGADRAAVTDKALRVAQAAIGFPSRQEHRAARRPGSDRVAVVGGGVAGTQAAIELARMGHQVDLLERRPFLGGRATAIGPVFPTGDCGPCLPATGAQTGVRKCLFRNVAVDHPNLRIRRRTEVQSVSGAAGDFRVEVRTLPTMVGAECIDCGLCEQACPVPGGPGQTTAISSELYDGRALRSIDLERCTFCGACAEVCPVDAIDLRPAADLEVLPAGAVLIATGCEPAPGHLVSHLGYGGPGVMTQVELAERLEGWEEQSWLGRMPARHLVMIQCAGSRDQGRLPYCSRLCCMIALKHAIRLRALFPEMRVTICFQELRTPGARDETWYLAARRAGVEFVRGSPARVELDAEGRPVVEVEDLAASELRRLRPDLVVLSTGLVPSGESAEVAHLLGVALDDAGFVAQLDAKNRTTETRADGVFVCGSASGPKTLAECITDAAAAAARVHQFLTSTGRQADQAASVDPSRCIGCAACLSACPFGAVELRDRDAGAPRPAGVRPDAQVARVDPAACRSCGICAAGCPELAITHSLDDQTVIARLGVLAGGVDRPVIGFTCAECAAAAFTLSGVRRDQYPDRVRLVELPCLGRISALHLVEAARLGAAGVFLAGCVEGQCHYRSGDHSAAEQVALAKELVEKSGRTMPIEQWRLCAVDHHSIGHRIESFCARVDEGPAPSGAAPRVAVPSEAGATAASGAGR